MAQLKNLGHIFLYLYNVGSTIAVFGCGAVGLSAVIAASYIVGASRWC